MSKIVALFLLLLLVLVLLPSLVLGRLGRVSTGERLIRHLLRGANNATLPMINRLGTYFLALIAPTVLDNWTICFTFEYDHWWED